MPLLLAFLIGAADVAAEMLVLRAGRLGLGSSAGATTLLVACVLSAYGLGAAVALRFRSPRAFSILRLAAGVATAGGIFLVQFLAGSPGAASTLAAPVLAVAAAVAYAIPGGASIPLLYGWARGSGSRAALLSAAAAAGGVVGAWGGGVFGPVSIGTVGTALAVLAANLLAAGLGMLLRPAASEEVQSVRVTYEPARPAAAWLMAAGAGMGTAGLESLAARVAPFFLDERSDAFATVLSSALVGLTLGALLAGLLLSRIRAATVAALAVAAPVLGGLFALGGLEALAQAKSIAAPITEYQFYRARLLWGLVVVAIPAIPLGALFPVAFALSVGADRDRASRLNIAYAIGALAPIGVLALCLSQGVGTATMLGALGFAVLPAALALLGVRAVPLAAPLACGVLLGMGPLPERVPTFRAKPWLEVLDSREGPVGVVSVVQDRRRHERTLFTNAFRAAATGDDYRYTRSLAHLALLLGERAPASVAVLNIGTGSTAAAAASHPGVERVDLVEISGDVLELTPWFSPASDALFEAGPDAATRPAARPLRSRIVPHIDDGRRHLARAGDLYDAIILEPLLPDMPSAYPFYTREYYALAKARLAAGGVLSHWIPIHATEPQAFRALVATFAEAFPHRALFLVGVSAVLLGSDRPLQLQSGRLSAALAQPALAADLRRSGLSEPGDLVAQCVLGDGGVGAFTTKRILKDDYPRIERLRFTPGTEVRRFESENLAAFLAAREGHAGEPLPGMEALEPGEREARRGAGLAYLRARRTAAEGAAPTADALRPALAAMALATAHPFAALDAQRLTTFVETGEGLSALALGDMATAFQKLERCARRGRDPLIWLAVAAAAGASAREADASVAAAVALALLPESPSILMDVWPQLRLAGTEASVTKAVELGQKLLSKRAPIPRRLLDVAEALRSTQAERRVAAMVAIAQDRDRLALEVERYSAKASITAGAEEAASVAAVARALEDPTLTRAVASIDAATRR